MTDTFRALLNVQHDPNMETWERYYAFTTVPSPNDHVALWAPPDNERSINARVEARVFGSDGQPFFILAPLVATYNDVRVWTPEGEEPRFVPIGGYADLAARLAEAGWVLE